MSSLARKYKPIDYIQHLYVNADGYIQVAHFEKEKNSIKNYKYIKLSEAIEEYEGLKDIFITPNSTYNGKRRVENIRQFRALYIDLDNKQISFNDMVYETWELAHEEKIPFPSMVVNSGRGCHLYWRIEDAPIQALATWQELEDYLYYQLKDLGADKKATDAARVLRLPGSINSRNGEKCTVMLLDDITYSMYDLREKYLGWKAINVKEIEVTEKVNKNTVKRKVLQFFTSYTLHLARAEDIVTLCGLRNYNVTGYRNMILHCYAYWIGVTNRDCDVLEELVNELNNKFTEPLKGAEVKAIVRCVPKAINKFIEYEQGLRAGAIKRVSKGMRDKGGYWYKNSTLIERLDITIEEQKKLKTIISEEEKYRRNADNKKANQKAKRRNKNGLTKKQQQKQDMTQKVTELVSKGLNNKTISEKLGISIRQIQRYKKIL